MILKRAIINLRVKHKETTMIFETGKTYGGGYTVASRTKGFVTFEGQKRRKIELFEGVETAPVYSYPDGIEVVVDIDAIETFFIPVVAVFDNRANKALPADHAHTMALPYSAPQVDQLEVGIMAASLGYSILTMGTLKKPMYRLMRDGLLIASSLYGMGLCLFDVRAFLEAEHHAKRHDIHVSSALERQICPSLGVITVVIRDVPQCGYAVAVRAYPEWFYDDDNAHEFDLDFERERSRMAKIWDRDCDHASSFGRN